MQGLNPICAASDLLEGGDAVCFKVDTTEGMQPAFALRWHGGVYAYRNRCPHVGLELDWNPGKVLDVEGRYLICAVHGALFEPATGECAGGSCQGQSLQSINIVEREGSIFLEAET